MNIIDVASDDLAIIDLSDDLLMTRCGRGMSLIARLEAQTSTPTGDASC